MFAIAVIAAATGASAAGGSHGPATRRPARAPSSTAPPRSIEVARDAVHLPCSTRTMGAAPFFNSIRLSLVRHDRRSPHSPARGRRQSILAGGLARNGHTPASPGPTASPHGPTLHGPEPAPPVAAAVAQPRQVARFPRPTQSTPSARIGPVVRSGGSHNSPSCGARRRSHGRTPSAHTYSPSHQELQPASVYDQRYAERPHPDPDGPSPA